MASPQPNPVLQKPPGYVDPTSTAPPKPPPSKKPVLPPSLRPLKSRRRGCCRCCFCACCIIILVLIFAIAIAAGLIYVVYDPHLPVIHLQSFRVTKLNVTNKPDGAYLDAGTATRLEVKNPNHKMVWYFANTNFKISADNGNLNLGSTTVPAFAVKEKNVTELKADTGVKGQALDEKHAKNLKGMLESKELVPSVEVQTQIGLGVEEWKSGKLAINVVCGDVTMKRLEDGEMPTCTITILNGIKIR